MSEKIRVEDHDNLYRDANSGSIECSDKTAYEKYMRNYHEEQRKKQEFMDLQSDVNVLKSEMSDIKSLLLTLVQNQEKTS